jgi:sugar transferase (PEP-CTERM system associated)
MLRLFRHYVSGVMVVLLVGDLTVVVGAVAASWRLQSWIGQGALWPKAGLLAGVVVFALYLADLYDPRLRLGRREVVVRLLVALCGAVIVAGALGFAFPPVRFGRFAFVEIMGLTSAGLVAWRLLAVWFQSSTRLVERVIVLGVGRGTGPILGEATSAARPYVVLGFVDDDPAASDHLPAGAYLLGKPKDLLNLVEELRAEVVVVGLRDMRRALPTRDLLECRLRGVRVEDWVSFCERQTGRILVSELRPSWLIFSDGFVKTRATRALKRALDVAFAMAGLALGLPLMGLAAVLIKLDSPGPVLFRQERVGQGGRIFVLRKFRSMRADAEKMSGPVWAVPADSRVTRLGRILRRTRLDELPQLFDVLVGNMSFVGPRPERPQFVQLLRGRIPFYMERHSVKPGLTGWAQVRYPYGASVEDAIEKLQYDLYYVKNLSLFLDLVILVATVQVVLFGRGAR